MKPLLLVMSAFGPYVEKTCVDFSELGSGLYLITGDTGSGKTTIFDAIVFGLYGEASGTYRSPKLFRSEFAKPEQKTFVELTFLYQEEVYKIRRMPQYKRKKKRGGGETIQPGDAELLYPDGKVVTGDKIVTGAVIQLLGLTREQFTSVAMIAQGEFLKLLLAKTEERGKILRDIFHTKIYQEFQERLKQKAGLYGEKKKALESKMIQLIQEIKSLEAYKEHEILSELCAEKNIYKLELLKEKLKELIQFDQEEEIREEEERKYFQAKETALLLDYERGKNKNEQLMRLEEARKEKAEAEASEGTVKKLSEECEQAEKAFSVKESHDRYQHQLKAYEALLFRKQESRERLKRLEGTLKEAKSDLEEKEARRAEIEELEKERDRWELVLEKFGKIRDLAEKESMGREKQAEEESRLKGLEAEREEKNRQLALWKTELEGRQQVLLEKERNQNVICQLENEKAELEELLCLWEIYQKKAKELIKLQKSYLKKEQEKTAAAENYEALENAFFREQAGILASQLKEGEACPVCGSSLHPKKAVLAKHAPTEAEWKKAKEKAAAGARECQRLSEELKEFLVHMEEMEAQIRKKLESLIEKEADFSITDQLAAQKKEQVILALEGKKESDLCYEKKLLHFEECEQLCKKTEESLRAGMEQIEKSRKKQEEILREIAVLQTRKTSLKEGLEFEEEEEADKTCKRIKKELRIRKEAMKHSEECFLKAKEEAEKGKAVLQEQEIQEKGLAYEVNKEKEAFFSELEKGGFACEAEFQAACRSRDEVQEMQEKISGNRTKRAVSEEKIKQIVSHLADEKKVNLENLEEERKKCETEKQRRISALTERKIRISQNQNIFQGIEKNQKEWNEVSEEFKSISLLSDTASGKLSGQAKVDFEHYVQAVYFERMITEANQRFSTMTGRRYELVRKTEPENLGSQSGLELDVIDRYTGKETGRSIRTLSGGECFKASLALALGMADVIQQFSGGIHIDSLFIDEGFGSLDSDSLDQALEALLELSEGMRPVGIISHVEELKERIEKKIVVTKSPNGSTLEIKKV